ncbi:hypothetical protein BDZ91DRAFT_730020 [Kalaharituber pfeilii]|nr:hypothetical protein BDZ91DRAFT_730020 [Kalaharituber pfeilii]
MKSFSTPLLLIPLIALPQASFAVPAPDIEAAGPFTAVETRLGKRASITCTLITDVYCRLCPQTSCVVIGQYPRGSIVTIDCMIKGEIINGNPVWARLGDRCYTSAYSLGAACLENVPWC